MPTANAIKTAFARRVYRAGLTFGDLAWMTNIKPDRISDHSRGKVELTSAEMERVNAALAKHAVVYTIFKRQSAELIAEAKEAVTA